MPTLKRSRFHRSRRLLIFWTLFIGLGAVGGAVMMLVDPSGKSVGMDGMLPCFQVLPFADVLFQNLVFSGISLLIVNGLTNLTAAALLLCKKRVGITLGGIFGITLMLWICIQFYIFPFNFMSTAYFVFGFCQTVTAYAAWIFQKQEGFSVKEGDYPRIGMDPKRLVVFFSRMGYVKQQAFEEANRTGAALYEIKAAEKIDGTAGFLWCGRFGLHRWEMPIEPVSLDLSAYEHVTICSPIWVFSLAAPVRRFCREAAGQIRHVDYILVHHTNGSYENAADEMDALLGVSRHGFRSVRCRTGSFRDVAVQTNVRIVNQT